MLQSLQPNAYPLKSATTDLNKNLRFHSTNIYLLQYKQHISTKLYFGWKKKNQILSPPSSSNLGSIQQQINTQPLKKKSDSCYIYIHYSNFILTIYTYLSAHMLKQQKCKILPPNTL